VSNSGFDPKRLQAQKRESSVVTQILSPDASSRAKGFTEIKVVGLGGAGNNTINRMIETGVQGIDFIAVNSDVQALGRSLARKQLQLGPRLTGGLGTGGDPKLGGRAAESATDALGEAVAGADMVFITAGLGGGLGTGAAPLVAAIARGTGALTVGVVSLPFSFEGARRRGIAMDGLERLRSELDSVIVVSNDRLLQVASANLRMADAFRIADETLNQGIHGIADLILTPGFINLDFADVRSVMQRAGPALMAMGRGTGEGRARLAAQSAIANPLLDSTIEGATAILLNITGGPDLTLYEVNEAASEIAAVAGPDCNFIFGTAVHPRLKDEIRVTVIATGHGRS
jgi:cell division protein FtsZ